VCPAGRRLPRPGHDVVTGELSDEDRQILTHWVRSGTTEQRMAERAKIILAAAEGSPPPRLLVSLAPGRPGSPSGAPGSAAWAWQGFKTGHGLGPVTSSASTWTRQSTQWSCAWTKSRTSRRWSGPGLPPSRPQDGPEGPGESPPALPLPVCGMGRMLERPGR